MKIRAIHSLFSAVSRKPTTCFSSWRTQWSLLSCGRTVSLRKKSSCCLQKPPQSNQPLLLKVLNLENLLVKWEEKMWIETSCRIAASTRLRRVDVGRNQCCHLCSDEQRLLEASMACVEIRSSMMKNLISSNSKLRWMVVRLCVRVQGKQCCDQAKLGNKYPLLKALNSRSKSRMLVPVLS
ncbi:hypothetical protein HID58_078576, partial [Brassica napus]